MLWKGVKIAAGPLIFVSNVTEKDRQTMGDSFNEAPLSQKGKIITNIVLGRTLGITVFGDEVSAPATFNLGGIFNKWTGLGIALKLYSATARGIKVDGKTLLPHGSKADQLATSVFTAGITSGVFTPHGSHTTKQIGTKHIKLSGTQQTILSRDIVRSIQINPGIEAQLIPVITVPDSAQGSLE